MALLTMPEKRIPLIEFCHSDQHLTELDGKAILICKDGDRYYALSALCSHRNQPLAGGKIQNGLIYCPQHGAAFELQTGKPAGGPAFRSLETFPVILEADQITIKDNR